MSRSDNKKSYGIGLLVLLIIIAIILWAAYLIIVPKIISEPVIQGQFGDMFGALNALFAAFAFAGLIYAILLQREDLKLTKEELSKQTEVITAQLQAMRESIYMQAQARHDEKQPHFIGNGRYHNDRKSIQLWNLGPTATDMSCAIVSPTSGFETTVNRQSLATKQYCDLIITGYKTDNKPEVIIQITYKDSSGAVGSKKFRIPEGTDSQFIPIP